jgi:hypothetical protein
MVYGMISTPNSNEDPIQLATKLPKTNRVSILVALVYVPKDELNFDVHSQSISCLF